MRRRYFADCDWVEVTPSDRQAERSCKFVHCTRKNAHCDYSKLVDDVKLSRAWCGLFAYRTFEGFASLWWSWSSLRGRSL